MIQATTVFYPSEQEKSDVPLTSSVRSEEQETRKESHFLDSIPLDPVDDSVLHRYAFHYLLLHGNQSLSDICSEVSKSIQSSENVSLSPIDQTRLQLLVLSLCTTTETGLLSLNTSLLDRYTPSEWVWNPNEKSEIMKLFKSSQQKQSAEIESIKPKRGRRSKKKDDEMIVEHSITLPTASFTFVESILTPFLKTRIEANTQSIDSFLSQMKDQTIE